MERAVKNTNFAVMQTRFQFVTLLLTRCITLG